MTKEISSKAIEARNLRRIIICGLIIVLITIVTAYIYFGMTLARNYEQTPVLPEVEQETSSSPDAQSIIDALQDAPVQDPKIVEEVTAALENATGSSTSDVEAVLEALGQPIE